MIDRDGRRGQGYHIPPRHAIKRLPLHSCFHGAVYTSQPVIHVPGTQNHLVLGVCVEEVFDDETVGDVARECLNPENSLS